MQNQIGELNVHEMHSAQATYSRRFDQFPGWDYRSLRVTTHERQRPNCRDRSGIATWRPVSSSTVYL